MRGPLERRPRRWIAWILLLILLAVTAQTTYNVIRPSLARRAGFYHFYDFGVLLDKLTLLRETGTLYETDRPDFLEPGSRVFKYPPPNAALLLLLDGEPRANLPSAELAAHARPFVRLSLFCLVATLGVVLIVLRPPIWRALVLVVVFLNWQAHWETLIGPQFELLLLLFLTVVWLGIRSGRPWLAGIPIGIAGALKIYPWVLGAHFLARRQWRSVLWLGAGALVSMTAAAFVVGWGLTLEYVTRILPNQGGTSAHLENLSLLGNLTRLTQTLTGSAAIPPIPVTGLAAVLTRPGPSDAPLLAWVLALPIIAALLYASRRALRSAAALPAHTRESLAFGLSISLALPLLPTSWANYQSLLALPVMIAGCLARPWREDRWTWIFLIAAALLAAVGVDEIVRQPQAEVWRRMLRPIHCFRPLRDVLTWIQSPPGAQGVALARSFTPLFVWLAHLRLLRTPPPLAQGRPQDVR